MDHQSFTRRTEQVRKAAIIWLLAMLAAAVVLGIAAVCNAESALIKARDYAHKQYPGDTAKQEAITRIAAQWNQAVIDAGFVFDHTKEREHWYRELPKIGINPTQCFSGRVMVPVPRPVQPIPRPQPKPKEPPKLTEQDKRDIAAIVINFMKANPQLFKGDKGDQGPKGDDGMSEFVLQFLDENDAVVPELTQQITKDNPIGTVPAPLIRIDDPDDATRQVIIGAPLGRFTDLHQKWREDEKK